METLCSVLVLILSRRWWHSQDFHWRSDRSHLSKIGWSTPWLIQIHTKLDHDPLLRGQGGKAYLSPRHILGIFNDYTRTRPDDWTRALWPICAAVRPKQGGGDCYCIEIRHVWSQQSFSYLNRCTDDIWRCKLLFFASREHHSPPLEIVCFMKNDSNSFPDFVFGTGGVATTKKNARSHVLARP